MSALILRSEGDLLMVPSMLRNLLNAERVLLPGHVIITRCQSVSVEVFVERIQRRLLFEPRPPALLA